MLQKIGFQPGINKQVTETGAESQWVDCDNVRFRYGTPEKIGGWKQLGESNLTGAESMVFENNAVTASYAPATGKDVDDKNAVDVDGNNLLDEDGNQVIIAGLKTLFKKEVKAQAKGLLSPSDWYIIRKAEDAGSTIPSNIATYRAAIRTKSNEMETAIDGAADAAAMQTLYTYTNTGTEESPVITRPLGEWPKLS